MAKIFALVVIFACAAIA
ncbi:unnamed protein product, partial [Allacma fusca]